MKNDDYQEWAKSFMDLWQKQAGSVVRDKTFIEAMLEMTKQWPNAYAPSGKHSHSRAGNTADADDGDLAQFAFRVGMCEQRLAALEAAARPSKRPVKAGAGRSRRGAKPRK